MYSSTEIKVGRHKHYFWVPLYSLRSKTDISRLDLDTIKFVTDSVAEVGPPVGCCLFGLVYKGSHL